MPLYECEECHETFPDKTNLIEDEDTPTFYCADCHDHLQEMHNIAETEQSLMSWGR